MKMNDRQLETKRKVEGIAFLLGIDPKWASAVGMVESSLGLYQLSRTGCKGVFQMSNIAMKDLLLEMAKMDDDIIDIVCGILFLRLLLKRHKTIEEATAHFCDPNDRSFYIDRVLKYMKEM